MELMLLPRIGTKGSWRSRWNAVTIFRALISGSGNWEKSASDYIKFAAAMALDHVYAVREAAFATFPLFPSAEERRQVIEKILEIAKDPSDLQRTTLKQFFAQARDAAVEFSDRQRIEEALTVAGLTVADYFK
jgi:hypothetical protein